MLKKKKRGKGVLLLLGGGFLFVLISSWGKEPSLSIDAELDSKENKQEKKNL